MRFRIFCVSAALAALAAGCTAQHPATVRSPSGGDSLQHIVLSRAKQLPVEPDSAGEPASEALVVDVLTLSDALGLAQRRNPSLAVLAAEIHAREASALLADLPPSPEVEIEVGNFAGQGELKGFDGAEATVALSQLIELGDKRGKRRRVAVLETDLAGWDYLSRELDVLASAAKAFIEVLVGQEQVSLTDELLELAGRTASAVGERVAAGKVAPLEFTRVQVELAVARSEASKASRELETARRRLASFWGAERAEFARVVGNLFEIAPLPPQETLQDLLDGNPDLARWESEVGRSEAALALARSGAVPDLNISAGVRSFQESGNAALVVGVSMPLPLLNRNQGTVGEARSRLEKVRLDQRAAEIGLRGALSDAWQGLSTAHDEASALRDTVLPGAQEAYESTDLGYREGKLDFLEMLDAQRTHFAVKRQYLLALEAYHVTSTELGRLMGTSPESYPNPMIDRKD